MVIGFIGFKQVGKSTAAKYLQETYGGVRINMKDALVAEIKQNFPDLLEQIARTRDWDNGLDRAIDDLFADKPPLMRALLQNYGTEVRRRDNNNYWVNKWTEEALKHHDSLIVVDDVRFINEAEAVKALGGIIVWLVRDDITTGGNHSSETEHLSIPHDYMFVCKGGDEETLYQHLDEMIYQQIKNAILS